MKKYRKKPIVIEAIQFDGENTFEIVNWAHKDMPPEFNSIIRNGSYGFGLEIRTLEGIMSCLKGDWIIKGINGEFYPCKPDIFEATYELVEQP